MNSQRMVWCGAAMVGLLSVMSCSSESAPYIPPRAALVNMYLESLPAMFDNVDRDRDDLLRLGNLACDKLRDGVDVRDGDALADIAGGIKVANGERSGPQGYGFIVGLSASTRCVDYLAASDLSCTGQTIVFAALAVSRVVQQRDRVGIWRVVQTLRPLRTATIVINGVAGQFPPEIPPGHREILDKIGLEVGH